MAERYEKEKEKDAMWQQSTIPSKLAGDQKKSTATS